MPMLEQIIQLITVLFLLSMICERIADFLKHYLNNSSRLRIGDMLTKYSGEDILEDKRYYRILKINIWCGILTALILKADLIWILNNIKDPGKTVGWESIKKYGVIDYCLLPFGIILTGCFISFGSKFWHDLLDLLLQTKNYKRLIADPETYKIDNINTIDKRITLYQSDFIQGAYLLAKQELFANPNVKAVSLRYNENGYYFEIAVKAKDSTISTSYRYEPQEGGAVTIPVSVVMLSNDIIPHTINLGNRIANNKAFDNWGTLGCIVTKNEDSKKRHYILTCYHNVVEPDSKFEFTPNSINASSPDMPGAIIGKVEFAIRDHEADAALIPINTDQLKNIINDFPADFGHPQTERKLTNADVEKGVLAKMYGARSQGRIGKVTSVHTEIKVKYSDKEHALLNVIALSNNGKAISQPGDSGCCILDENNRLLGILVAGNDATSYAIPASTLFLKLNISLIKS